ncbi:MAG: AIPR family protein [Saprospiraceae bacterium]|nr:AIPR family protein [Saprospiraceae bacterium]
MVSNENIELDKNDHHLKQLEDIYGLEVIPIGLPHISKIMSIRPSPVSCELVVDKDAVLSFSESSISSSKSYVLRLSISELVRITCNDSELRDKYNIEDYLPLSKRDIDYSILFDNVRGLVLRSKINPNISKSLKEEPSKFFLYNNGVTIVADDIVADPINANKKEQEGPFSIIKRIKI